MLGFVLKTKGDQAGALREFKAELANNPEHWLARDQIGEIEMGLKMSLPGKAPPPVEPLSGSARAPQ